MSDSPPANDAAGESAAAAQMSDLEPPPAGGAASIGAAEVHAEPRAALDDLRTTIKRAEAQIDQLESHLRASAPGASRPPAAAHPWRLPAQQAWFLASALCVAIAVVFLRLFLLDSLQNEFYGDIEIVYDYVARVRAGEWPLDFVLSAGPLYHYLIAPLTLISGMNYFGLKLASVLVSLGVLISTYALSRRLIDDHFALLAVAIAGVSSWLLIWSRLGNSQILVPLLTTTALWLTLRVAQDGRRDEIIPCAVVSALGLYTYPQSFVLPGVTLITLLCLRWTGYHGTWADLRRFVLVTVVSALPFATIVYKDPQNFFTGYIGGKIVSEGSPISALFQNLISALLAFHVRGDSVFRHNPSELPHLDWVSGALFLAGVVFWLQPTRRRLCPALLVPFALLQLPSVLVLGRPSEVPSAARTLGVAPLAYVLVASGLWWLARALAGQGRRRLGLALAGVLLAAITLLNIQRYFLAYIDGLPYHNTSISARIAVYVDALPPETQVYLVGCCWESGMPETPLVKLVVARPDNVQEINPNDLVCDGLQFLPRPAVLIWSFYDPVPPRLESCKQLLPAQLYLSPQGWPVFYAAPIRSDMGSTQSPAAQIQKWDR